MCGASLARLAGDSPAHHGVPSARVRGRRRADTQSGGLGRPATGGRIGEGAMWGHALCALGRSLVDGRGDRDTREALANRLRDVLALV